MIKCFATFGSGQLGGFSINPMDICLYIDDASEIELRKVLQDKPFDNKYCTTYPIDRYDKMHAVFGMYLISLDKLMELYNERTVDTKENN